MQNKHRRAAPCEGRSGHGKGAVQDSRRRWSRKAFRLSRVGLRLGVQGGGCSGLSYNIRFDSQPRERDRIFQFGDVRVFVDPKSFIYLHGMMLDYQETLMQQGFVFVNPELRRSRAVAGHRSRRNCVAAAPRTARLGSSIGARSSTGRSTRSLCERTWRRGELVV